MIDYPSSFIKVEQLYDMKSVIIVKLRKSELNRYDIADTFLTDNGPQFSSDHEIVK